MQQKCPLVSVVIPSYNRAGTLAEAARSVLHQTYPELELILVDDGSTDATPQLAEALAKEDARVRYVRQENAGACAARNHGAQLAKGEYIAFHDSDDVWYPEKLERQMAALQQTQADICICKLHCQQPDGLVCYPKRIREGFVSLQEDLFGIGTQTIVARRAVLEAVPFRNEMPRYQDLEWIYRAMQQFTLYCVDAPLVDYRIGADSISKNPEKMYRALELLRQNYPTLRTDAPQLALHIVRNLLVDGWREVRRTDPAQSRKYWALALHYLPGPVRLAQSRLHTQPNNERSRS